MNNHAVEIYNQSSIKYTMTGPYRYSSAGSLAFSHITKNINHIDSLKKALSFSPTETRYVNPPQNISHISAK